MSQCECYEHGYTRCPLHAPRAVFNVNESNQHWLGRMAALEAEVASMRNWQATMLDERIRLMQRLQEIPLSWQPIEPLIRAAIEHEREACAVMVESVGEDLEFRGVKDFAKLAAHRIRARGGK